MPIQAAVCAFALMPLLRLGLPENTIVAWAAVRSDIVGPHIIVHTPMYSIAHKVCVNVCHIKKV